MIDNRSPEAAAFRGWYKTRRWKKLREYHLTISPLCEMCIESEIVEAATVVHHRKAHRGDAVLFWDPNNLQGLCKSHHDREGRLEDNGKTVIRYDASGWPL
ncbi:HNH endonuclease signature motif containing protein [Rhizobium ruizarguesonis]|nr:HNH endonuclease [Rhizobium leguminosarum]